MDLLVSQRECSSVYSTLPQKQSTSYIRVLELFPGARSEELRGRLACVDLQTARYQALSYTWGSSSKARHIILNERVRAPITNNLYDALRRLREHHICILWVDALCIDQKNLQERNAQVAIMSEIYRQADAVNVWLGEPGYVPKMDTSLLSWPVATEVRPYIVVRDIDHTIYPARTGRFIDDPNFMSFFVYNDARRFEQALRYTRPRWQDRGWVVQEFALAKCVYICAGTVRKMWQGSDNDFAAVEPMIYAFANEYPHLDSFMQRTGRLAECVPKSPLYLGRNEEYGATLFQTYHILRATETSDPRDKIYSLVGILNKEETAHIPVDYSLTAVEVFARTTCAFLITAPNHAHIGGRNSVRSFDPFALVTLDKKRLTGLPSWCIHFCQLHAVSNRVNNKALLFCSGKDTTDDRDPARLPRIVDAKLTLEVPGYIPDSLVDICQLAFPWPVEISCAQDNAITVDDTQVHKFAQRILVFARKAINRSKRQPNSGATSYVSRLTGMKYGPQQLCKLEPTSLIWGKRGKYLAYEPSTYSCMKHCLSDLLQVYVKALGLQGRDFEVFEFLEYCRSAAGDVTLFATSTGLLGLAPSSIVGNEILVARPGSRVVMLLRPDLYSYIYCGLGYLSGYGFLWGDDVQRLQMKSFLIS